jgi:hypothetical protein
MEFLVLLLTIDNTTFYYDDNSECWILSLPVKNKTTPQQISTILPVAYARARDLTKDTIPLDSYKIKKCIVAFEDPPISIGDDLIYIKRSEALRKLTLDEIKALGIEDIATHHTLVEEKMPYKSLPLPTQEPTMEDILGSIRKILSEDVD